MEGFKATQYGSVIYKLNEGVQFYGYVILVII